MHRVMQIHDDDGLADENRMTVCGNYCLGVKVAIVTTCILTAGFGVSVFLSDRA